MGQRESAKTIHYCWFGGKPLSKLSKKCIESWKKYLPDYEIKRWDESNFDVNITEFSKKAYGHKKWAFVSDVARVYALKEYGGIYLDTDMEITKDISFLLDNELWLGREVQDRLACGVIGVKNKNNKDILELFDVYKKIEFDEKNLYNIIIPNIFTNYFKQKGLSEKDENQILKDDVHIYKREYFYPVNFEYLDDITNKNTCMIHYYKASWLPFRTRFKRFLTKHKMNKTLKILELFRK